MSTKPSIRVALPWLHEAIAEARDANGLPSLASLAWLAGRAQSTRAPQADWRQWLLGGVGPVAVDALRRWPAGPSLAAMAGAGAGTVSGWALAQPVHLATGMDHLRMAPLADAVPSPAEAEQIAATLRGHFPADVLDLADFVDGAWLVRSVEPLDCATHDPCALAGRNIHDYMPSGAHGGQVRSVMNEIQMLLHDHPVNQRRAATRALPINALWLWGFGRFDAAPEPLDGATRWTLQTDDAWLRAFWRIHGGAERALGEAGTAWAGNALIAMAHPPTTDPTESLAEVNSSLLTRLCRRVQSGELHSLALLDGARVHVLDAASRFRFWRRPAAPAAL
jgi:hypothetical protein